MGLPKHSQNLPKIKKHQATSTVGRAKSVQLNEPLSFSVWSNGSVTLRHSSSLDYYDSWEAPTTIISDGGYGILGFEGDTSDHLDLPEWYEPHIEAWSKFALPSTTLWFWNSEIGWAVVHANKYGRPEGKPYFSIDGKHSLTGQEWSKMRAKFNCPHGFTNVWNRPALRSNERIKSSNGKAVHLNQKPLDLMKLIIEASSGEQDVIWEPFGGLFSASLAANILNRKAFACEIDETYFFYGVKRFSQVVHQYSLF